MPEVYQAPLQTGMTGEYVSPLVKDACSLAKNHSFQWIMHVKQILDETGYSYVWSYPASVDQQSFETISHLIQKIFQVGGC